MSDYKIVTLFPESLHQLELKLCETNKPPKTDMEANNIIVERPFRSISLFNLGGGVLSKAVSVLRLRGCIGYIRSSPGPETVCKLFIQFYGNQPYINLYPL